MQNPVNLTFTGFFVLMQLQKNPFFNIPGELAFTLWLLIKGVDGERWKELVLKVLPG